MFEQGEATRVRTSSRGSGEKEVRLGDEEMDVGQAESAGRRGNEEHVTFLQSS